MHKKEGDEGNGRRVDYAGYRDRNLSILSEMERKAIVVEMDNPGAKRKELAELIGISERAMNSALNRARKKLDGTYDYEGARERDQKTHRKERKKDRERARKYYEEHKKARSEYAKKYYEKNKEKIREKRKEYEARRYAENPDVYKAQNRRYYLAHREEILEKEKIKRQKKKEENK